MSHHVIAWAMGRWYSHPASKYIQAIRTTGGVGLRDPVAVGGVSQTCATCASDNSRCRRCEAFERLPDNRCLQALLTFVSGVPHRGQTPLFQLSPLQMYLSRYVSLLLCVMVNFEFVYRLPRRSWGGVLASALAITVLLIVTSGLLRSMHQFLMHGASHGVFGNGHVEALRNWLLGELAVMTAVTLPFQDYFAAHPLHHRDLTFTGDGDQAGLASLGFTPGQSISFYWKRLMWVLMPWSQMFRLHVVDRIRVNLTYEKPQRILSLVILQAIGPVLVWRMTQSWWGLAAYTIVWGVPITYGYFVSLVLYALGLHRWWYVPSPDMTPRAAYLAKTGSRFFLDPLPLERKTKTAEWVRDWTVWWARLIVVHLLISKLGVIGPTDNQHHDAHHADPTGKQFMPMLSAYSRATMAASDRLRGHMWHTWTLFQAIRTNFEYMASLPPQRVNVKSHAEAVRMFAEM